VVELECVLGVEKIADFLESLKSIWSERGENDADIHISTRIQQPADRGKRSEIASLPSLCSEKALAIV
jgi:hypothetical protein